MRRLFVTTLMALVIPAAAFAGTLKENMKAIGGFSKQISASVNDSTQNAVNADRAAQMNALFQEVFTQAEDGIANIPAEIGRAHV